MEFPEFLANIALRIRQSLHLEEILKTTVAEVRQWLQADRVMIYRFNQDWSGIVEVEAVNDPQWSILGRAITDPCLTKPSWLESFKYGKIASIEDIKSEDLTSCHKELLKQYQVQANLIVPIILTIDRQNDSSPKTELYGLLIAHECSKSRKWLTSEVNLLQQLATQVAIAIQQGMLFEQLQKSNKSLAQAKADLEQREGDRTLELEIANQQLRKLNQELTRSNQELEQFGYIVSHDLREPLRMVTSFTQLLGKRYSGQLDAEADQIIDFAIDGATRMEELIYDLLIYSRVGNQEKKFTEVNCNEILEQALSNLSLTITETNAQIAKGNLPTVMGDRTQLTQLFQNLIANSIKYQKEALPIIQIDASAKPEHWLFWVKDNGIGIDPKYSDRIFQIFQRLHTRQEYPGTGTGLAICHKIVERHNGKIWVDSEIGQGATFYFTLPV